jgi:transposase
VGLTRRGKGSKLMLVVENQGLPIGGLVTSAQKAEVKLAEPTLATVRVPRPRGRPRSRPKEVVADKGYDSAPLRQRLRRRGIKPCIPERRKKRPRPGRKAELAGYRERWKVERTYAWLGNFRRLVVRYERLAHIYLAFVLIAFILICSDRILK